MLNLITEDTHQVVTNMMDRQRMISTVLENHIGRFIRDFAAEYGLKFQEANEIWQAAAMALLYA